MAIQMIVRSVVKKRWLTALFIGGLALFIWGVGSSLTSEESSESSAQQPEAIQFSGFMVGAAKIDITPDPKSMPVPLNGYGDRDKKPAIGVLDPLYARALVVKDPTGKFIGLVSADLCYINSEIHDQVVRDLKRYGFTADTLLLAATHTHGAFAGYDHRYIARKFFGEFDQRLFNLAASGLVNAVIQAKQHLQPAVMETTTIALKDKNRSRRDPAFVFDETNSKGSRKEPPKPDPKKYPVDPRLTVARFRTSDSRPIAVFINFASHPTVISYANLRITADWPGAMCKRLEERLGGDAIALFFNGTEGDSAPPYDWSTLAGEIAQSQEYGAQMADEVTRALSQTKPSMSQIAIGHKSYRDFSIVKPKQILKIPIPPFLAKGVFYMRPDVPFQAVRMGDLLLMGVPGEPTCAVGKSLEAFCPAGLRCLTISLANDHISYIVSPDEYPEQGYASEMCFFGPETAIKVKDGIASAIQNLK